MSGSTQGVRLPDLNHVRAGSQRLPAAISVWTGREAFLFAACEKSIKSPHAPFQWTGRVSGRACPAFKPPRPDVSGASLHAGDLPRFAESGENLSGAAP